MRRKERTKFRGAAEAGRAVPLPPRRLSNNEDNKVIEQLTTAPVGNLKVDRFAEDLRTSKKKSPKKAIVELRLALIRVYVGAATFRANAKVPIATLKFADAAVSSLWTAISHLEKIKPRHARGLAGAFVLPTEDLKGLDEWNDFSTRCWNAKLELTELAMDLEKTLRAENKKPSAKGERKKRLRVLVEALADWWVKATDKTIAPYVQSKPLGDHRAFVAGRSGRFIEFSLSVLSQLDTFKESEVISTIINVYDIWRRMSATSARKS
jgi:hypothetical protein